MQITIFGLGYVGCVTSACLASLGHDVIGVDPDVNKVNLINKSLSPLIEPGLENLLRQVVSSGHLKATAGALNLGDVSFICVGTPSNANGSLCLDYVIRVSEEIGDLLRNKESYHVVTVRSTVLPGTVEKVILPVLAERSGKEPGRDFGLCMNPEFLREATALKDFHAPPFTVLGSLDARSGAVLGKLYKDVEAPLEQTTIREAEMIKYACNAFHALKVCFANEIGVLSKSLEIDSHEVMEVFCKDRKLNLSPCYLKPGFAFGGSCLPKDLRAILYRAKQQDLDLPLLGSLLQSNHRHLERALELVKGAKKRHIGILGLSFKPGTDDMRESPVVILIERLLGQGYELSIYDKEVSLSQLIGANRRYIEQTIPHIASLLKSTIEEVLSASEVVVIGKIDPEFRDAIAGISPDKKVIDLVRVLPEKIAFQPGYQGICW